MPDRKLRMTPLVLNNLDDALHDRLRLRAERHGRSIEEEASEILRTVVVDGGSSPKPSMDPDEQACREALEDMRRLWGQLPQFSHEEVQSARCEGQT